MQKFRNNLFYLLAMIGFAGWIVNVVAVMRICGVSHPILFKELFYLGYLVFIFYAYSQKMYENIQDYVFNRRVVVTPGDTQFFRVFGPWLCLLMQLILTMTILNLVHRKLFSEEDPQRACQWRGRFQ